jgi:hypothetical protein
MPVRPIEQARIVFAKHVNDVLVRVRSAHDRYLDRAGPVLSYLETRTKRGMVRDLIVDELRSWSDLAPGVQYFRSGNLTWFGFENNWIVRVKYVDDGFGVRVSPTEDSRAYNRNEIPESIAETLLDSAPATTLYLGWRTTENAPATPDVSLVCNNHLGELAWVWPLSGRGPHPELELPVPEQPAPAAVAGTRVRLKDSAKPIKKSG